MQHVLRSQRLSRDLQTHNRNNSAKVGRPAACRWESSILRAKMASVIHRFHVKPYCSRPPCFLKWASTPAAMIAGVSAQDWSNDTRDVLPLRRRAGSCRVVKQSFVLLNPKDLYETNENLQSAKGGVTLDLFYVPSSQSSFFH